MSFFNDCYQNDMEPLNSQFEDYFQKAPQLMESIEWNQWSQMQNDDDEKVLCYDQLSQGEKSLHDELVSAGFNMENTNLKIIQMINSMQLQLDVLEKVIFNNSQSPLFQYHIDFNQESTSLSRNSTPCQDLERYSSEDQSKSCYKLSATGTQEEKMVDLLGWQDVNQTNKQKYLMLRQQISELKSAITQSFTAQQGSQYICMICSAKFENGRKLGGHISRKHPAGVSEYNKRKAAQQNRVIEKKRRNYFKKMNSSSEKTKLIAKQPKTKGKRSKQTIYQQYQ